MGFVGAENLVPIPCKKIKRESKNASKKFGEYRVGFMLEAALACTGYKLQGRNEKCAKNHYERFCTCTRASKCGLLESKRAERQLYCPGIMANGVRH